jgi:hypothetical protein
MTADAGQLFGVYVTHGDNISGVIAKPARLDRETLVIFILHTFCDSRSGAGFA